MSFRIYIYGIFVRDRTGKVNRYELARSQTKSVNTYSTSYKKYTDLLQEGLHIFNTHT